MTYFLIGFTIPVAMGMGFIFPVVSRVFIEGFKREYRGWK